MLRDEQTIKLTCIERFTRLIKNIIKEYQNRYLDQKSLQTIVRRPATKELRSKGRNLWTKVATRPLRPMDTVVLEHDQREQVLADINEYLQPASSPEHFSLQGQSWSQSLFPETWFTDTPMDDEGRCPEIPSITASRIEGVPWPRHTIASANQWLFRNSKSRTFTIPQNIEDMPGRKDTQGKTSITPVDRQRSTASDIERVKSNHHIMSSCGPWQSNCHIRWIKAIFLILLSLRVVPIAAAVSVSSCSSLFDTTSTSILQLEVQPLITSVPSANNPGINHDLAETSNRPLAVPQKTQSIPLTNIAISSNHELEPLPISIPSRGDQPPSFQSAGFPNWAFPILCTVVASFCWFVAKYCQWKPIHVSGTLTMVAWWLWLYLKRDQGISPWFSWPYVILSGSLIHLS